MRILHGAALTMGFLLAFPAAPALASHGQKGQKWADMAGFSLGEQSADTHQTEKLRVAAPVRLTQLQLKLINDTGIQLLDLMMDRRRKKKMRRKTRRHKRKVRRHKRKIRRHNRKVRRHNRKVIRHNRKVRRVRRHTCPGGYYWSSYQRRCIKSCRAGSYYSYVTGSCRRRGRHWKKCPSNFYWNHSRRRCISRKHCGPGSYYSYALRRCKRIKTNCTYGWRFSPYKRRCVRRCPTGWNWNGTNCAKPARTCPTGYRWSAYYKGCVSRRTCPTGFSWNGYRCRRWRRCAAGTYWSSFYKKCRPKVTNCPAGYRYRSGWGCVRRCGAGWHWTGSRCQKNARRCPSGKFYSYHRRRCISHCGRGFFWSFRKRRCVKRRW